MAKFKVGDKVRILDVNQILGAAEEGFKTGGIYVLEIDECDCLSISNGEVCIQLFEEELQYIEKVNKPIKNQRITALEKEVAELKAIVHELRKPSMVEENKSKLKGITIELEKTPNQQRKEIIEKAKQFLEESKRDLSLNRGRGYIVPFNDISDAVGYICEANFVVDENKRTVVALMKWNPVSRNPEIKARGIAKCMPGDVFNEHIGKAIALGRALELDVSEFEQAVQPTFAKGQIAIVGNVFGDEPREVTKILNGNRVCRKSIDPNVKGDESWDYAELFTIINDTNAIY